MSAGLDWMSFTAMTKTFGIAEKMLVNWAANHPADVRKDDKARNCKLYLRVSAVNAAFEDCTIFGN